MTPAYVKYLGDTSSKTAGTTVAQVLQGTTAPGNLIVARVLFDNAATASKPIVSSISKMAGETNNWVFLGAARSTNTTAGAFASGEMWAIQTTVAWTSGTSITVTLDTSVTQKAVLLVEFSGVTPVLRSTVGTATSATTTAAIATTTGTTPLVNDLALGYLFGANVAAQQAGSNNTTGGSWSAVAGIGSTGGSAATNNFGVGQYKVLTAAGHQTYNNSALMTAGNAAIVAILVPIQGGTAAVAWGESVTSAVGKKDPKATAAATHSWVTAAVGANGEAPTGSVIWSDDFNRPDQNELGPDWLTYGGYGWLPYMQIASGQATHQPAHQETFAVRQNVLYSDDQFIKFDIPDVGQPCKFGLYQTNADIATYKQGVAVDWQGGSQIYWWVGGTFYGNPNLPVPLTGAHTLELRCVGTTASLLIDDVIALTRDIGTFDKTGRSGQGFGHQNSNATFDNMSGGATDRVLFEPFTGTDGAAWPTTNFNFIGTPSMHSLQNGWGQVQTPTAAFNESVFWPKAGPADFLLTFDMVMTARPSGGYFAINFRKQAGGGFPGNSIELEMTGAFFNLSGGGVNVSSTPPAIAVGDVIHYKLRGAGSTIQAKVWLNATPEPDTWLIDSTGTTSLVGQNEMQFICKTGGGGGMAVYQFDNIKVYDSPDPRDLGAAAPPVVTNNTATVRHTWTTAAVGVGGVRTGTATVAHSWKVAASGPVTPGAGTWSDDDFSATDMATHYQSLADSTATWDTSVPSQLSWAGGYGMISALRLDAATSDDQYIKVTASFPPPNEYLHLATHRGPVMTAADGEGYQTHIYGALLTDAYVYFFYNGDFHGNLNINLVANPVNLEWRVVNRIGTLRVNGVVAATIDFSAKPQLTGRYQSFGNWGMTIYDAEGGNYGAAPPASGQGSATVPWRSIVAAVGVAPGGAAPATMGYRTINAPAGDRLYLNSGNIGSDPSLPETWVFAGRLLSLAADAEIISNATWDPLDFFLIAGGTPRYGFHDESATATDGPAASTSDAIVVFRRSAGGVARWSLATNTGTGWSATTHTTSAATFASRSYPASGVLEVGGSDAPAYARFAAMARADAYLSDAQVASLTTGLNAWDAITEFTNFWEFGPTVVDHRGTASLSSVTGTTVSATGFPLAPLTAGPSGGGQGTAAVTWSSRVAASGSGGGDPIYLYDDFTGSSLDLSKWVVYDRIMDEYNGEVGSVIPANVRVPGDGKLYIDQKYVPGGVIASDTDTPPTTVYYTSGQIAQKAPSFLYGDVQVRAKIPGGTGTWPCIWMLGWQWQASQPYNANTPGQNWPHDGWNEIDIAEFGGGFDRSHVSCQNHFESGGNAGSGVFALPYDSTTRFMVYRLVWTRTSLTWMVDAEDGVGWRTLSTITGTAGVTIPDEPMYLVIHCAIGGGFAGTPDPGTYPQVMEVDYARVTSTTVAPKTGTAAVTWSSKARAVGRSRYGLWKGAGVIPVPPGNVAADLTKLDCSWFYDWASYSVPGHEEAPGFEYVPMMWGDWINDPRWGTATGDGSLGGDPVSSLGSAGTLLGFNEPNQSGQANMTVARALELWPQLVATGARLGSPATSGDGMAWFNSFMAAGPKVDFVCAHWYLNLDGNLAALAARLDYLWTTYGKPIWLTEISDTGSGINGVANWIPQVMSMLLTRPFVERVGWFTTRDNSGYTGLHLVNNDGTLNAAGTAYAVYQEVVYVNKTGTAAVSWNDALTAAGKRTPKATSAPTWTDVLAAVGKRAPKAVSTPTHTWVTAAQGVKPIVGAKQGNATVSWVSTLLATGKRAPKGTAITTTWNIALTATGKRVAGGVAAVSWVDVLAGIGKRVPKAVGTATHVWTLLSSGKRSPKALTTAAHNWALTAQGVMPTIGARQGSALVTHTWTAAAVGSRPTKGASAVTYSFTTLAVGKKITKGVATTTWNVVTTAAGKRFPKTTVAVAWNVALTAAGKRASRGTTAASYQWSTSANGYAPIVGFKQGFATVTPTWTVAAVGKRTAKGVSPVIANTWSVTAAGKRIQKGTTSLVHNWALSGFGKKVPKGSALVVYLEEVNVRGKRFPRSTATVTYRYTVVTLGLSGIAGFVEGTWNDQEIIEMMYGDKSVIEWMLIPS
jgi:beta-glucanase (GH16 family)